LRNTGMWWADSLRSLERFLVHGTNIGLNRSGAPQGRCINSGGCTL
jgi:hypothetical protein